MRDSDECRMPMLRWVARGRPLIGVVIWTPIVLFGVAQHAYESAAGWVTWLGLVVIAAANLTAIVIRIRHGRESPALFSLQAAATLAVTATDATDWYMLYCLLAIAASIALTARWALVGVTATTAIWATADSYAGAPWSELWVTTLCLALAGIGTFVFFQLIATISELNATRDALARNAVAAERERFSRDLHDVLGHSLSLMVVKAQAVRRLLPEQGEAAAEHAADIETIGRHALDEARTTVRGYRETTFESEVQRAQEALRSSDVELSVDATALPVAHNQDALLGWAVREATTNVLRHSAGQRCRIDLSRDNGRIVLSIGDDGRATTYEPGSGLSGLRARFTEAGGEFEAGPTDHGFTVTATLPATRRGRP